MEYQKKNFKFFRKTLHSNFKQEKHKTKKIKTPKTNKMLLQKPHKYPRA